MKYLPNFTEFANERKIELIVQRTSKHFPDPAQITVLAKHKLTGNGVLYTFNPITGEPVNGDIVNLDYAVRQVSVLQPDADYLRGILLLDSTNRLHAIPANAASQAHGTYIYCANKETGIVTGYYAESKNNVSEASGTRSTCNIGNNLFALGFECRRNLAHQFERFRALAEDHTDRNEESE